jgi:3-hydroxy-9,10-secoandrosta-1,3,5(10)-triene-9,17-dione monooxygenase
MAQGAVDEFTRRLVGTSGAGRTADSVAVHLRLGEASAQVDAARSLHRSDVREMLEKAARGEVFTDLDRARYRRDKAFVARLAVLAVNTLFEGSGAHAVLEPDPLQRVHRDVHAASHHAALGWDPVAEHYGRQALAAATDRSQGGQR